MTVVDTLAAISKDWLAAGSSIRQEAVPALQVSTGYSKLLIERALDAVFAETHRGKNECVSRFFKDVPVTPGKPKQILHIVAGNVFTAWLHGAVITLLVGHRVGIKPSSQEPVFAALWKKSVARHDPALAESIRIVAWSDRLAQEVDGVIAYGSDETLQVLREKLSGLPFVGYGHKMSIAIVFSEAALAQWHATVNAVCLDIEAFDLDGCLSPQIVYVQDDANTLVQAVQAKFHGSHLPQWKAFDALETVWRDAMAFQDHLSCVGIIADEDQRKQVEAYFVNKPEIRICKIGEMQKPPLDWRNGGVHLGEFLLKYGSRLQDP